MFSPAAGTRASICLAMCLCLARAGAPGPLTPRASALQLTPRGLVIVEGHLDARAVRRAVRDSVVIHTNGKGLLDGKSGAGGVLVSRVRQAGALPTVLTDPDLTGLELRNHIDGLLNGECLHAFLPAHEAELRPDSPRQPGSGARYKETGNVGVQHASAESIAAALRAARPSEPHRAEFSAELLAALGLTAAFDSEAGPGASKLRHALCDALGIGRCNGKQLLRQLNCYGFTREEVSAALERLQDGGVVGLGAPGGGAAAAEVAPARSAAQPRAEPPAPQQAEQPPPPPPPRAPARTAAPPPPAAAPPLPPPAARPAAAHQKVVTDRSGSIPVQYAGPKPMELLQTLRTERSASGLADGEEDDNEGDWTEGWEEWDDDEEGLGWEEDDGVVEEDWDAGPLR